MRGPVHFLVSFVFLLLVAALRQGRHVEIVRESLSGDGAPSTRLSFRRRCEEGHRILP